jgi:membrane-bound lytic murein transglycosylase B
MGCGTRATNPQSNRTSARLYLVLVLAALPAPDAPIPRSPAALVRTLTLTERRLDDALVHWNTAKPPPRTVTLLALYEQRTIRLLASDARLAKAVLEQDPGVRDHAAALRELHRLTALSAGTRSVRIGRSAPAARLIAWYREAQQRFGVRWLLLAAINFVESAFDKVRNATDHGAQGPMQFEPATWSAYGLGGDVRDQHDAIIGAANYLAANGGSRAERRALPHYNPSPLYDNAVLRYAHRIARDSRAFLVYYSWQVYITTRRGARRITGPR